MIKYFFLFLAFTAQAAEIDNLILDTSLSCSYATPSTVPYFDGSKDLVSSSVTSTELGYLSGVTSSIQTQLNSKQSALSFPDSVKNIAGVVTLANDSAAPGVSKYYGTNVSGTLGYFDLSSSSSVPWGNITGTLSNQTDLQTALNAKQNTLTIGNFTDAGTDGLTVTGGTGSVIGSGTSIAQHVSDSTHNGYLSSTDWSTFNGKQNSLTIGNLTDVGTDGLTVTGGTGSVIGTGTSISQHVSDSTHNGYLSLTDWGTFNSKQAALTIGNFTDTGIDGIVVTGGTGSIIGTGTSIAQHVADTTHAGYLSSTDWNTFNGKQSALTIGNLTDTGTDGITVTSGTGSVIGTGTSLSQHVADTTHAGYLSSTDWNTFNGKQAAGNYITALTGDVSASGPGSAAATLATVNANVGSFGSSTSIPSFTVNGKGLITAASGNVVIAPAGTLTGTTLASNVVTSSLTTVGTIGTGTWSATAIANTKGGTGGNSSASTGLAHVASGTWSYSAADLTSSDVTGVLPIANGGTNAATVSAARVNIGVSYYTTYLNSGTTWTSPASSTGFSSASTCKFTLIGSGGAGSGSSSVSQMGAGGGAGGTALYYVSGLTPNNAYSYTIGTGGTGASAANGGNGGNSTLVIGATTITATGGIGGTIGLRQAGGLGGTPTNGTINIKGQDGGPSMTSTVTGGSGGSTEFGAAGIAVPIPSGATQTNGNSATGCGSGGGSSGSSGTGGNATGGNGANGCLLIECYN